MKTHSIPYKRTGYFSDLICDYLGNKNTLNGFYENYPDIDGFKNQIKLKAEFETGKRKVLTQALRDQYKKINLSELTDNNIQSLEDKNTFTVTTGHQLNLFTGPLYFLYKIFSTINLCEKLKNDLPEFNFVPIYWMATEDHDFEEINYFNFNHKKVIWKKSSNGAVGRLSTEGLDEVYDVFVKLLGGSKNAIHLSTLFNLAYLKHDNLADATRYLANELFREYGLVILDGDDKRLKEQFIPFVENELTAQTCFNQVSNTIEKLGKNYKIQVNPREINLFYLTDELRERIIFKDDVYRTLNNKFSWTKEEIIAHLHEMPERFSPNVIMRPLYQEVVLPNLCYIGGGGELAYWFELKAYFDAEKVPFPILLLRNSALLISNTQVQKLQKMNISLEEIFYKQQDLINKKIKEISEIKIDFSEQRKFLEKQFLDLEQLAKLTDKSFIGAVNAQKTKQLNGLNMLEKRLLKAQKRKLSSLVNRITDLQNDLFPNESLEERTLNFSEVYLKYGKEFLEKLKSELDPLKGEFQIITL